MLKYINEIEYVELSGATSIPDSFNKLVIEASSYINRKTFGRIDINNISSEVKYTTCLIIDLIIEQKKKISEIGNLKSQNIEGWSETYSTPDEIKKEYANKKEIVLKEQLWDVVGKDGNYLLYRGE
nr:MAG TPA: Head Tail Connector Protein [Caudoviricetes sp.]